MPRVGREHALRGGKTGRGNHVISLGRTGEKVHLGRGRAGQFPNSAGRPGAPVIRAVARIALSVRLFERFEHGGMGSAAAVVIEANHLVPFFLSAPAETDLRPIRPIVSALPAAEGPERAAQP